MLKFSEAFENRPKNFFLLPSFPAVDLESDGVHLTAISGLEYILFLFDSATTTIDRSKKPMTALTNINSDAIRTLEDRVVVLEQDRTRMSREFESKAAIDAEFREFQENVRYEDHFLISGLAKPSSGLTTQEWQTKAKQDVGSVILILLDREAPIRVVHNQTGQRKVSSYLVKMVDVKDACEVRSKFGSFFAGGKDGRPAALSGVSVSNWTTPGTKVRIAILKVLAARYRSANSGSRVQVVGYESRPLIRITPPPESSDRRVKVMNLIEAIRTLPTNFTADKKASIMMKVNPRLYSKLRSLFVVIDDDLEKINRESQGERSKSGSKGRATKRPNPSPSAAAAKSAKV